VNTLGEAELIAEFRVIAKHESPVPEKPSYELESISIWQMKVVLELT
jgi:hypothetical protein